MNEQQYQNAIAFIEVGARAMANQERDLSASGRLALAGADVLIALHNLYESREQLTAEHDSKTASIEDEKPCQSEQS